MNEDRKLTEAEYFYGQMLAVQQTQDHFVFNLSAFLTAARSVLQYAHEEAAAKPGGQGWYDRVVAAHPSIRFFRDKRDLNVHTEPVEPHREIVVQVRERIGLSEAVEIQIFEGGKLVGHRRSETPSAEPAGEPPASVVHLHYRFADWPGGEDVIGLCRTYLDALKALVADGQRRGFLS